MKTFCFKIYYRDIDTDDIIYIEAKSRTDAIKKVKKEYRDIISDYKFLGEE